MSLDLVKPAQIALLAGPSQEERDKLAALERSEANHAVALASLHCLQRLEAPVSELVAPLSFPLTVAAWNLERCYAVEKSAEALIREDADIALLTEVDNGMARTGQRHTSRELAGRMGMAYAFGVEFLELELGAEVELAVLHRRLQLERLPRQRARCANCPAGAGDDPARGLGPLVHARKRRPSASARAAPSLRR
jgi:hypothetical protein